MAAGRRIYLDHNASAPLLGEARDALTATLNLEGNPSSVHQEGRHLRKVVEDARSKVAALVGASDGDVVFTSGASEAAATCLTPDWVEDGMDVSIDRLAVLDTDHPCLRDGGRFRPEAVTRLGVEPNGIIDWEELDAWLSSIGEDERAMLALTLANSETGVLQPIAEIQRKLEGRNVILVVDAVQAAGRMPMDIVGIGADALILSGHKIGAAKGVGAVVLGSERLRPYPLLIGGGQEKRRRAGTEAVSLIASFGAAAAIAKDRAAEGREALRARHDHLEAGLCAISGEVVLIGEDAPRIGNTVAVAASGLKAETAQIALDLAGFAVSAGSACSSGKVGPSHVLQAMARKGAAFDPAAGAIRVSFGHDTAFEDLDAFLAAFARVMERRAKAAANLRAA